MPSTDLGIPFATLDDAPNGPAQMQAMSDKIDDLLETRIPACAREVFRTSTATLPNAAFTPVVSFNGGTDYNVGDILYGAGIFTVQTPGLYQWSLAVQWPAMGTSDHMRSVQVYLNGSTLQNRQGENWEQITNRDTAYNMSYSGTLPLAAGDQLQPVLYQSSGATRQPLVSAYSLVRLA